MKPNTQLNHVIGLATEHLATITIDSFAKRVTVYIGGDKREAQTDNRDQMAAIADWLALMSKDHSMYGNDVTEGVKASATAFAEADNAIKQHVDKGAEWMAEVEAGVIDLDPTAPGQYV